MTIKLKPKIINQILIKMENQCQIKWCSGNMLSCWSYSWINERIKRMLSANGIRRSLIYASFKLWRILYYVQRPLILLLDTCLQSTPMQAENIIIKLATNLLLYLHSWCNIQTSLGVLNLNQKRCVKLKKAFFLC